jgi:hypothetical protein
MLEYVFFEEAPRLRFQAFLEAHGVRWTLEPSHPETLVVIDDTGLDDDLTDRVESVYDELFALEQRLFAEQRAPTPAAPAAPRTLLRLKDGTELRAELPPELTERLLTVISREELDLVADAIVCAFEDAEGPPPD